MKKSSKKLLKEGAEHLLPTHPSDASNQTADSWDQIELADLPHSDKSKELLPTHASDASAETADSLKSVGAKPVKPELDGKKAGEKALKEEEKKEEEEKEDEKEEMKESDDKDADDKEEMKEAHFTLDSIEKEVVAAMQEEAEKEMEDEKEEMKESDDKDADDKEDDEKKMEEHLNALTSGENLSEEFQNKARVIFETAVKTQAAKVIATKTEKIKNAYKSAAEKAIKAVHERLTNRLSKYTYHIVEQWEKENEVAIKTSLVAERAEKVLNGLRSLLAENHISVPEEQKDIVTEKEAEIQELKTQLNEEMSKNVELRSTLDDVTRKALIRKSCEGLTDLDAETFKGMVSELRFEDRQSFENKLLTIKESYFAKKKVTSKPADAVTSLVEEGGIAAPEAEVKSSNSDEMDIYVSAISRAVKNS